MNYKFQSTLPARGATETCPMLSNARRYFNPRSPHGERPKSSRARSRQKEDFNPRSPHGERRVIRSAPSGSAAFQSTLPARGATQSAPKISPRCPFQSTLPARGATGGHRDGAAARPHFNPRSPHGERHAAARALDRRAISIHAPRTGSDGAVYTPLCERVQFQSTLPARGATMSFWLVPMMLIFQSTLPARGATLFCALRRAHIVISIHAPRTGSDAHKTAPPRRG